MDKDLNIKQA